MNKNIIIIAILAVLLIASIGWGWSLLQEKTTLEGKIKTLESENAALQGKIDKGLSYVKALDVLFEAVRKSAGLPTREENLTEEKWLSDFSDAASATGDNKLQDDLNTVKKGGSKAEAATVSFMEHAASAAVDALK